MIQMWKRIPTSYDDRSLLTFAGDIHIGTATTEDDGRERESEKIIIYELSFTTQ